MANPLKLPPLQLAFAPSSAARADQTVQPIQSAAFTVGGADPWEKLLPLALVALQAVFILRKS